jgi:hypothetical protein
VSEYWHMNAAKTDVVRKVMFGWDITDFESEYTNS